MKVAIYGLLVVLFALHTDVWYWNDPGIFWGLPVGISYHLLWTLAVTAVLALAVKYAWPADVDDARAPEPRGDNSP